MAEDLSWQLTGCTANLKQLRTDSNNIQFEGVSQDRRPRRLQRELLRWRLAFACVHACRGRHQPEGKRTRNSGLANLTFLGSSRRLCATCASPRVQRGMSTIAGTLLGFTAQTLAGQAVSESGSSGLRGPFTDQRFPVGFCSCEFTAPTTYEVALLLHCHFVDRRTQYAAL